MQKIRNQKKISAMIIVIMLLQIIIPLGTIFRENLITVVSNAEGTEYNISTEQELWDFATTVNNGNSFEGITVNLLNDIKLECNQENNWIPIGSWNLERPFNGIFEGNNYNISGMYINNNISYQGLFGFNTGEIRNLNVSGYIKAGGYIGGIVGKNYGDDDFLGRIINCSFDGEIFTEGYIGGIVGYSWYGEIENCYNKSTITGDAGGIAGILISGEIKDSYNLGNLKGLNVGGIVADNRRNY